MIADTQARRIASEWHSGEGSPLYQFASTGTITEDVISEAEDCCNLAHNEKGTSGEDCNELFNLCVYLVHHDYRDQQEGWGKLTWQ